MMKPSQALMSSLLLALCTLVAVPAQAQTRAALVQNMDEPGRSPYTEFKYTNCIATQQCRLQYSAVPAGKRLVLTYISGYTHVAAGTLPDLIVVSWTATPTPTQLSVTAVRGATFGSAGSRMYFNQAVMAYFEPGDIPLAGFQLPSTNDHFSSYTSLQLSGYYVTLP